MFTKEVENIRMFCECCGAVLPSYLERVGVCQQCLDSQESVGFDSGDYDEVDTSNLVVLL